jgi:hypothetical protein
LKPGCHVWNGCFFLLSLVRCGAPSVGHGIATDVSERSTPAIPKCGEPVGRKWIVPRAAVLHKDDLLVLTGDGRLITFDAKGACTTKDRNICAYDLGKHANRPFALGAWGGRIVILALEENGPKELIGVPNSAQSFPWRRPLLAAADSRLFAIVGARIEVFEFVEPLAIVSAHNDQTTEVVTTAIASGRILFLGSDLGEWGGGLTSYDSVARRQRFELSGAVTALSRSKAGCAYVATWSYGADTGDLLHVCRHDDDSALATLSKERERVLALQAIDDGLIVVGPTKTTIRSRVGKIEELTPLETHDGCGVVVERFGHGVIGVFRGAAGPDRVGVIASRKGQ